MALPYGKAAEQFIESRIQAGVSPKEALIELFLLYNPTNKYVGRIREINWAGGFDTDPAQLGLSPEFMQRYYFFPSGFARTNMEFAGTIPVEDLSYANVILTSGKRDDMIIAGMRTGDNGLIHVPCTSTIEGDLWIPVLRYQVPGTEGLFRIYEGKYDPAVHCGTFYYLTPDLHIYLKSKKTMIVPILDIAWYLLRGTKPTKWMQKIIDKCAAGETLTEADYAGGHTFGIRLDQPVCTLARTAGIDVVIITYPFGSEWHPEVLDTRDRPTSFASLVRATAPVQ